MANIIQNIVVGNVKKMSFFCTSDNYNFQLYGTEKVNGLVLQKIYIKC